MKLSSSLCQLDNIYNPPAGHVPRRVARSHLAAASLAASGIVTDLFLRRSASKLAQLAQSQKVGAADTPARDPLIASEQPHATRTGSA